MADQNIRWRMGSLGLAFVFAASLGLASSENANDDAFYCPTPDTVQKHGIPDGFILYESNTLAEEDHSGVTDLDTVRLDQASAEIIDDRYAIADYALCLYGTNIPVGDSIPFYILRTRPRDDDKRVLVDFTRHIDSGHSGWGGFCWGPEDRQKGCIVVCHFHAENCPFQFSREKSE